jgi:DNA-binding NarL/FixJ family response regulator
MLEDYLHPHRKQNTPDSSLLTSKEKEILKLVAEGQTSEKIALNLDMSRRTVEKYRGRIMNKLKIDNLAELVKFAIREGLVNL